MKCLRKPCFNQARVGACPYQGYCSRRCADLDEGVNHCARDGCTNEAISVYCSRRCTAMATNNIAKAHSGEPKRRDHTTPDELEAKITAYFRKEADPTYYSDPRKMAHLLGDR